jgi:undecaprenyl diphosphate synthase
MNKLNHIAIIMDGNRRWARKKGLPAFEGHVFGRKILKKTLKWCVENKIKYLTVYAFSTENWNRPKIEVSFLMNFLSKVLEEEIVELHKDKIRMCIAGQKEKFTKKIQELIKKGEKLTKKNKRATLQICLSYGGHSDIVDAIKKIKSNEITEKTIRDNLYNPDIPNPDLIVRTGGEMRLSNFLTWQSVYSELYFTQTLWPDFGKKEFNKILKEYYGRQRRFGK